MKREDKIAKIKEGKYFAIGDLAVFGVCILLIAAFTIAAFSAEKRPGKTFEVISFGKTIATLPLEEDAEYVSHINLFRDIAFFMTRFAQKIRGEKSNNLGEAAHKSYIEARKEEGTLTDEEADAFVADAEARLRIKKEADSERKLFEERNFYR